MQFKLESEDNGKLNFLDLTVATVSYTHLDVYKRQVLARIKLKNT